MNYTDVTRGGQFDATLPKARSRRGKRDTDSAADRVCDGDAHYDGRTRDAVPGEDLPTGMNRVPGQTRLSASGRPYDLEERTGRFAEEIVRFARSLERDRVNLELVSQIVRSGTSVGANYMEADAPESRKDFRHKIALCRKEAKETMFWLRAVAAANPTRAEECRTLWREARELTLIFSTIYRGRDGTAPKGSQ